MGNNLRRMMNATNEHDLDTLKMWHMLKIN